MINLLFSLPKDITIAFSGGVDSVAIADFLSRKHNVKCAFFHHKTENSEKAFQFVTKFCEDKKIPLIVGFLNTEKLKNQSLEEFWRIERYKFLENIDSHVITAHHLDDCVETYIHSSLHGKSKVIPYKRNNILRPFLVTPKKEFINWCERKKLKWCEDDSNLDSKYIRNYIRHELVSRALIVNPGIFTTVKKIVLKNYASKNIFQ